MENIVKGSPMRQSMNGINHTCPYHPSWCRSSFTDPRTGGRPSWPRRPLWQVAALSLSSIPVCQPGYTGFLSTSWAAQTCNHCPSDQQLPNLSRRCQCWVWTVTAAVPLAPSLSVCLPSGTTSLIVGHCLRRHLRHRLRCTCNAFALRSFICIKRHISDASAPGSVRALSINCSVRFDIPIGVRVILVNEN